MLSTLLMATDQRPSRRLPGLYIDEERSRFAGLLLAQLFFISITPFVSDRGSGGTILLVGVFTIMFAGIYAASLQRGTLILSIVILLPSAWAWMGPDLFQRDIDDMLRLGTAAVSFVFTAFVVLYAVSKHQEVTVDTILGGINVYLLMAFAFLLVHATVMVGDHGAYAIGGAPLSERFVYNTKVYGFVTMLYFSFTTITTLGYGDIVPVSPLARLSTSAEAVIGQLYIAIFIGRLVGLGIRTRMNSEESEE